MASSVPQTYHVSDFIEWRNKKQLILDPEFQRGAVWTSAAKTFLIDTILRGFPIPQIFLRTRIDTERQATIREVVDGQQRLRTIFEFADGKLRLSSKANEFAGKTYNEIDQESKERFLSYSLSTIQLINAENSEILEIFARLNSYSVRVTPAELRHARYSEPVKWRIWESTRLWGDLWSEYRLVSVRDAVRMKNNSFMAELFMTVENGLSDGGEPQIDKYYRERKKEDSEYFDPICSDVDHIVQDILDHYAEDFAETTFFDGPNFLLLFIVVGFLEGLVPSNSNTEEFAQHHSSGLDHAKLKKLLFEIVASFDADDVEGPHAKFVLESRSSTQRRKSRTARFEHIVNHLTS